MKKRGLSLLLAILILVAQIPLAFAVTASGTCGDNLMWTLDDSGTLTISDTRNMTDFPRQKPPWYTYKEEIKKIVLQSGIHNIGNYAFTYFGNLTDVIIASSITHIGTEAFRNCHNLANIEIPHSVISIGDYAFNYCDNRLTNITIPDSVVSIGHEAFANCHSLKNITIPGSVERIGYSAFSDCYVLTNVTLLQGITAIESSTFYGDDNLISITLPNSIISIGSGAFSKCENLNDVYYGGSQTQWETINIDGGNESLTNATVHYNSTGPDSEPVTPTPVDPEPMTPTPSQPAPQTNSDISKYSYAFDNSANSFGYSVSHKVSLEGFQMMFGDALGKDILDAIFDGKYWNGNCYGMATTAAMLTRVGSSVKPSDFRNGATRPGELQVSDNNSQWNLTLARFIEAMQASQYGTTFTSAYKQNLNNLSGLRLAMSAFEEGGLGSLVICVHGFMDGYYSGHALLAYHLDGQRLYVYDCNHPNDGNRYITISENGWSYPLFDNVTWDSSDGEITYIPYETYLFDWYNRGHLLGDQKYLPKEMLIIDDANVTISDSSGHEVATFRKGKMVSGIDEAYPIPHLGVTADGVSASRPPIAVWLPYSNEYKVTTQENATVSAVSVNRDVSVNSVKGGQTVSVSLTSSASPKFEDVSSGQYFYDAVMWAVDSGITNGTTATTFSPHNTCTRNHILTFLWRANGSPSAIIGNPFTDVDTSKDFGKAAVWAYEKGLVSGKQFNGGAPCSRADVVTYLWKLAGRPSAGRSAFKDVPSNADYAQAVSWAVERGVTKGTTDTTFEPSKTCTRGQIVTFLYRAYVES